MNKNVLILALSSMLGALLAFVTQIMLTKMMTLSSYGKFSSAFFLISIVAPIAPFGAGLFWLKAFGKEGYQANRWIQPSIVLLKYTLTFCVLVVVSFATFFSEDREHSIATIILISFILSHIFLEFSTAIYQLEGKYFYVALFQLSAHFLRFSIILLAYLLSEQKFTAIHISIFYLFSSMLMTFWGGRVFSRFANRGAVLYGHSKEKKYNNAAVNKSRLFREIWPFGVSGFLYLAYFYSGSVLLGFLGEADSAGIFSIALTVLTAVFLIPTVIYSKYLQPKLHRWVYGDTRKITLVFKYGSLASFLAGLLLLFILYFSISIIVKLVLEEQYIVVANILKLLSFIIPIRFLASNYGSLLNLKNNIRTKVKLMFVVAVFNLGLMIPLIELYGLKGAAYGFIMTEVFQLILYYFFARQFIVNSLR